MLMNRTEVLLAGITPDMIGIEVAPYHSPLVPKSEGFNSLSLDMFDTQKLKRLAAEDPNVQNDHIHRIEEVDFVGSACEIDALVCQHPSCGEFDYVISSHNFEHLPDPIRFLQGCSKVLKDGGRLIMAIPDKRACFDYFRPHTQLSDWLEAFFEKRAAPKPSQVFSSQTLFSALRHGRENQYAFFLYQDTNNMVATKSIHENFKKWEEASAEYCDAHCSLLTPNIFRLLLEEVAFLGLHEFRINKVSETNGHEFYVELIKDKEYHLEATEFDSMRNSLLLKIQSDLAFNAPTSLQSRAAAELQAHYAGVQRSIAFKLLRPILHTSRRFRKFNKAMQREF